MRLDYTLYILAVIFFLITTVAAIALAATERSLWVVTTAVLGILSVGIGYYQRPKAKAETCQPAVPIPQATMLQTQQTAPAPKEEAIAAPAEPTPVMETATVIEPPTSAVPTVELTQVKGIGEKRASQLKAIGISNVDELAKSSAADIAKSLKISPKIVDKWISGAKDLVK
jgi:predicted flap endonuclease-1-like 5' DNA nuclease